MIQISECTSSGQHVILDTQRLFRDSTTLSLTLLEVYSSAIISKMLAPSYSTARSAVQLDSIQRPAINMGRPSFAQRQDIRHFPRAFEMTGMYGITAVRSSFVPGRIIWGQLLQTVSSIERMHRHFETGRRSKEYWLEIKRYTDSSQITV
jgi:hypothetical protein